jgi:protein-L-isoaspartate O-methyltransferase
MRSGTQGYAEQAAFLVEQYEALGFEHKHSEVLHLLPTAPARVLDIGAGTGADAAWLADQGHAVLAVEPTAELREAGQRLHTSPRIAWLDDALPDLRQTLARGEQHALVMLTAVWMHLDATERSAAFPHLVTVTAPSGRVVMTLRHGPVPEGRRMFEVSADETDALAAQHGLLPLLRLRTPSRQPHNVAAGVSWTRLVYERPA